MRCMARRRKSKAARRWNDIFCTRTAFASSGPQMEKRFLWPRRFQKNSKNGWRTWNSHPPAAPLNGQEQHDRIQPTVMNRANTLALAIFLASVAPVQGEARKTGKLDNGLERLLYVTGRSGISVYDINDSHKLLSKIDVPDTGDYKGISASVSLGKLYVTSYRKDELVCVDLATEKVDWRRHYSDGYADSQAMTPDGKTIYLPL